jgi:hypothetical protein
VCKLCDKSIYIHFGFCPRKSHLRLHRGGLKTCISGLEAEPSKELKNVEKHLEAHVWRQLTVSRLIDTRWFFGNCNTSCTVLTSCSAKAPAAFLSFRHVSDTQMMTDRLTSYNSFFLLQVFYFLFFKFFNNFLLNNRDCTIPIAWMSIRDIMAYSNFGSS